jgi:membrane associated rhomboid family serine protease
MPLPLSASDIATQAKIIGGLLALMWALELVDQVLLRHRLDRFGIVPRTHMGLRGILFAPLLHGTWQHLIANTLPFAVLGWLALLRGVTEFTLVTVVIWFVSGAGVWLLAAPRTLHIGASGIIFGYFGFLLSRSYFEQDLLSAGIALVVRCFTVHSSGASCRHGDAASLGKDICLALSAASSQRVICRSCGNGSPPSEVSREHQRH